MVESTGEIKEQESTKTTNKIDFPSTFKQFDVIFSKQFGKVELKEFSTLKPKENDCFLIQGFACGATGGETASLTSNYIVEQLNLPVVGEIVSDRFLPLGVIREGQPTGGIKLNGNENILVMTSDYEIKDPGIQNDIVKCIFDFCERHKVKTLISVDGLDVDPTKKRNSVEELKLGISAGSGSEESDWMDEDNSQASSLADYGDEDLTDEHYTEGPKSAEELLKKLENEDNKEQKVWFVTNDEELAQRLEQFNALPAREIACTGISGGILSQSTVRKMDTKILCLFAPLNKFLRIGTRSSIVLIHSLDKIMGNNVVIDTSELKKSAENLEKKLKEAINKLGPVKNLPESSMYM
ncbi:hypothetical protein ABK040_016722 [Willaertia magna]